MSDATLIRIWPDYSSDPMTAFVGWNDGRFSLPEDHPAAQRLWSTAHRFDYYRITVYSTDELEWVVDSIHRIYTGEYHIECIPRVKQLRACLMSDDYLIEVWLSAEAKWNKGRAEREALVDQLAHILREAYIRGDYDYYAGQLVDSGWRKGEPA